MVYDAGAPATFKFGLDSLLPELSVEAYCTVPIISDEKWEKYVQGLPAFASEMCSLAT